MTLVDAAAFALGAVFTGADPSDRALDALALLASMGEAGTLTVQVGNIYPLADARRAHQDLEDGAGRGKLLLATAATPTT